MAKFSDRGIGQAIFRYTHQKCQELFIATYQSLNKADGGRHAYGLRSLAPIKAQVAQFPETVGAVSPTFVTIYNQAVAVEAAGLDQVVGIALRKALEFLIKDFAVAENPAKTDEIKAMQLAPCIGTYIGAPSG